MIVWKEIAETNQVIADSWKNISDNQWHYLIKELHRVEKERDALVGALYDIQDVEFEWIGKTPIDKAKEIADNVLTETGHKRR